MRLPFPERLPLYRVMIFCVVLNLFQWIAGTSFLFMVCTTAFTLLSTVAFNLAGGVTRPSGTYILAYAVLAVLFGISYKAFILGEPGQRNLLQPELTPELYVATAFSILVAAYLSRFTILKRPRVPRFSSNAAMGDAVLGSLLLGIAIFLLDMFGSAHRNTSLFLAALDQVNYFAPLAIVLGSIYEIRKSGGKRSINPLVFFAMAFCFIAALPAYSKEGFFMPFACWMLAVASQRYKTSLAQLAWVGLLFGLVVYYFVPYSQYGRNYRVDGDIMANAKVSIFLLSNLGKVHDAYQRSLALDIEESSWHFYDRSHGFADRLEMIAPDDSLINVTQQGAVFGIFPTITDFENVIPHVIWPSKPIWNFGNQYAHEVGGVAEDDYTTGISFSITSVAFHQAKWLGVLVMLPLLLILGFFAMDSFLGDTRESAFSLMLAVFLLHVAPEQGTSGLIHVTLFIVPSMLGVAFVTTRILPIIGKLFLGSRSAAQTPRPLTAPAQAPSSLSTEATVLPYRWSSPTLRE